MAKATKTHFYKGYAIDKPEGMKTWNIRKVDENGQINWCFADGYGETIRECKASIDTWLEEEEEEVVYMTKYGANGKEYTTEIDTVTADTTAMEYIIGCTQNMDNPWWEDLEPGESMDITIGDTTETIYGV